MTSPNNPLSVFIGMISVLFANAIVTIMLAFLILFLGVSLYSPVAPLLATIITFVLTQILCLHTLRRRLIRQGKTEAAKGLVMGAVITALINGGCFIAGLTNG